jgi:hypothetical protein
MLGSHPTATKGCLSVITRPELEDALWTLWRGGWEKEIFMFTERRRGDELPVRSECDVWWVPGVSVLKLKIITFLDYRC